MPLELYGLLAGIFLEWSLGNRNLLSMGGAGVMGFGIGIMIRHLATRFLPLANFTEPSTKTRFFVVGLVAAEIVAILLFGILWIFGSRGSPKATLEGLLIVLHTPVVFWFLYLWQDGYKRYISSTQRK